MSEEIKTVGRKVIQLADLHHQYVKTAYRPEVWHDDMGLPNSPHVEIMQIFKDHGFDQKRLADTRYVAEKRTRRALGRKQWTDEYIFGEHLKKRWKVFQLVKKGNKKWDKPVRVLEIPFWKSRFENAPEWLKGPELWDGHGRASAMYALGYKEIEVEVCKDCKPGTKQWAKIQKEL